MLLQAKEKCQFVVIQETTSEKAQINWTRRGRLIFVKHAKVKIHIQPTKQTLPFGWIGFNEVLVELVVVVAFSTLVVDVLEVEAVAVAFKKKYPITWHWIQQPHLITVPDFLITKPHNNQETYCGQWWFRPSLSDSSRSNSSPPKRVSAGARLVACATVAPSSPWSLRGTLCGSRPLCSVPKRPRRPEWTDGAAAGSPSGS